jgi:hypothetical protein
MVVLGCTQGALLCFLFEPVGLGQYSNHPGFLDSKSRFFRFKMLKVSAK